MKIKMLLPELRPYEHLLVGVMASMLMAAMREEKRIFQHVEVFEDTAEAADAAEAAQVLSEMNKYNFFRLYISGINSLNIDWLLKGKPNLSSLRTYTSHMRGASEVGGIINFYTEVRELFMEKTKLEEVEVKALLKLMLSRIKSASVSIVEKKEFTYSSATGQFQWDKTEHTVITFKD